MPYLSFTSHLPDESPLDSEIEPLTCPDSRAGLFKTTVNKEEGVSINA